MKDEWLYSEWWKLVFFPVFIFHFSFLPAEEVETDSAKATVDSVIVRTDSTIVMADTLLASDTTQTPDLRREIMRAPIYQGLIVKLDIGSTAMVVGMSKGAIQHYEIAVNVRLKNRFYPTLELGYAGSSSATAEYPLGIQTAYNDSLFYSGRGGFFRVGCDINPLKKHPESPHAMLIGIRLGAAVQAYSQDCISSTSGTLGSEEGNRMTMTGTRGDCWGEIVGGCQVEVAKVGNTAFYMGWQARFRALFTRTLTPRVRATISEDTVDVSPYMPAYIPGFGKRDNIGWGLSYHLAWKF